MFSGLRFVLPFALAIVASGCTDEQSKPNAAENETRVVSGAETLSWDAQGMPVPASGSETRPEDVESAAKARAMQGDRGSNQRAFDDGVPLLPSGARSGAKLSLLSTTPVPRCITADGVEFGEQNCAGEVVIDDRQPPGLPEDPPDGGVCEEGDRQQICAEACATATASAYAYAFAHASARACAWASAFACVWTRDPFSQVCAWAQSQSCATAFASAFAFGFAVDTQTVCNRQCAGP